MREKIKTIFNNLTREELIFLLKRLIDSQNTIVYNIEEKEKNHISADAALANIKTSLVSYPSDPKLLSLYIQLLRNEIPFRTFLERIGEG